MSQLFSAQYMAKAPSPLVCCSIQLGAIHSTALWWKGIRRAYWGQGSWAVMGLGGVHTVLKYIVYAAWCNVQCIQVGCLWGIMDVQSTQYKR